MLNIKNKKLVYLVLGILALVSIIVYFKSFKMGFMSDDFNLLKDPPINPFSPRRWEPIQGLIFFITNKFNFSPFIPRVFFFFLHLINIFLVYKIIEKLTRKTLIGLLAAFIFTLFYRSPQVIYWISAASADLISTTFYLAAIVFYIYFLEKNKKNFYWLSFVSFLLGLLTKESVILLPFALFLIEFTVFNKIKETRFRTIVNHYLPFVGLALIFILFYMFTAIKSGNPFLSRSNYTIASARQFFDNYTHFFLALIPIKFRDDNFYFSLFNILIVNSIVWIGTILAFLFKKIPGEIPLFLGLILIFLFPYALYGWGYQERYVYLAALAFAGIISYLLYRFIITFSYSGRIALIVIFLLIWGTLSFRLIKIRGDQWELADMATKETIRWAETNCRQLNLENKGFLFNFPSNVNKHVFILNNGLTNLISKACKETPGDFEIIDLSKDEVNQIPNAQKVKKTNLYAFGYINSNINDYSDYYDKIEQIFHDQTGSWLATDIFSNANSWAIAKSTDGNELKTSSTTQGLSLNYKLMPQSWVFIYDRFVPVIKSAKTISLEVFGDEQNENLYLDFCDRETGSYFRFEQKIDWLGWKTINLNLKEAKRIGENIGFDDTDGLKISIDSKQEIVGKLIFKNFQEY